MHRPPLKGYFLAVSAAIFWGVSGTCAQYLFENRGFNPEWLVNVRLLTAGFLLLLITGISGGSSIWKIWTHKTDVMQLLIFSVVGMAMVQYTYFAAIGFSNAATATVLQYIGPAFIVAWYAIRNRKWPVAVEFIALTLAITGTFLLVTHGSFKSLSITPKAFLWGMLAALTLAFYTIQPAQLLKKYSPASVTGWGMLIGGIGFSVVGRPWNLQGQWDSMTWACFTFIIILGTLAAFFFFLTAVKMSGAKTASLLACAEPLSAAVTAVIWLKVPFGWIDWLGTICILATIIVLTLAPRKSFPGDHS